MDDHLLKFEERALKNVRALLDKADRDERIRRETPVRVLLIVGGVFLLGLVIVAGVFGVANWLESRKNEQRAEQLRPCLMKAEAKRTEEIRRRIREEYSTLSDLQVEEAAKYGAREAAKADCANAVEGVK